MGYISAEQLRRIGRNYTFSADRSRYVKRSKDQATVSIFLSHSHKDRDLVEGFINLLTVYKIFVYVDWQDTSMPRETNRVTAERLKERIGELDWFLLLATENISQSIWVPWEVGIADTRKLHERIAIIPIVDSKGEFKGSEYLQLYQRIEFMQSSEKLVIFPPGASIGRDFGISLRNPVTEMRR